EIQQDDPKKWLNNKSHPQNNPSSCLSALAIEPQPKREQEHEQEVDLPVIQVATADSTQADDSKCQGDPRPANLGAKASQKQNQATGNASQVDKQPNIACRYVAGVG